MKSRVELKIDFAIGKFLKLYDIGKERVEYGLIPAVGLPEKV